MLLQDLADTSDAVAATRSRLAKVEALADLLKRMEPDEIAPALGLLLGKPRQGRIGVGWRGLAAATGDPAAEATLTIAEVDETLGTLAAASGQGSNQARASALRALLARATDREQSFLGGALLGEVRTGALEGVVTDAVAKASHRPLELVRRAAMLSGDLGETARTALTGTEQDLADTGLVVGRAILPMLASTAPTAAEAVDALGTASVEYKLDGARIQVHRSGDDVRIFTRNLADITHRLPEIVEVAKRMPVHDVVLDGETLALDENDSPRAFQDTMSRFGADVARLIALRPWFFDVLHVDGRDLIDEPLSVRLAELERVAPDHRIPGQVTADPEQAERISQEAIAAGHEGVVVKGIDSTYAAGRRGASWIKVKPVHTFDLVVLAVEKGSGRRSGMLSNIHLGALDPVGEFGEPGEFVMVGKTFKGMTDATLAWQTEYFPTIATGGDDYTVHVRPVTVVEIAIDGVQRSPRYPGGIALRFARVKTYRDDKRPEDADTIQTLRGMLHA
ncbi:ATP-dependent DNA ligase [Micromonospora sp. DT81.3]|uniref:ATP-dependent DNA ligase n=1 Tax=Micromonospora sp. DT81.3 TaxID=3416523 RepID=UPI003CF1526D